MGEQHLTICQVVGCLIFEGVEELRTTSPKFRQLVGLWLGCRSPMLLITYFTPRPTLHARRNLHPPSYLFSKADHYKSDHTAQQNPQYS